jgi:hypothetical protein
MECVFEATDLTTDQYVSATVFGRENAVKYVHPSPPEQIHI